MLTDLSCKALIVRAKQLNKPLKKADGGGLYLYALPTGKAYWRYKYRLLGREKLISLGAYPAISLTEARTAHDDLQKQVAKGINPAHIRKQQATLARIASERTFEVLGRSWLAHNAEKWSEAHARKIRRYLEKDLFRMLGKIPVSQLTRKQLLTALQEIEGRKAHNTAKRSQQFAYLILNHAMDEEDVKHNIAQGLGKSLKPYKTGHYPSMEIDDLPQFLHTLDNCKAVATHEHDAVMLLLLTMVRRNELLNAEWSEFDFDKAQWVIPASRMKMRRKHIVPLSRQAIEILQKRKRLNALLYQGSPYVFPAVNKRNKPIYSKLVAHALHKLGYKDRHTAHGFRALGMGIAKEKLGYRHEVPDRQLAHLPAGDVDKAYDRAGFLAERIKMMQELADHIDLQRG